jgi:transposase
LTAGDLIEAINHCISQTRKELEQQITDANTETYPSINKVAEIFGVNRRTLTRWKKDGILTPIEVGGGRRYRMSEVKRILDEGKKVI